MENSVRHVFQRVVFARVQVVVQIDAGSILFLREKCAVAPHVSVSNKAILQKTRLSPISVGALIIIVIADVA
jgi:hypothetical protein